MGTDCRVISNKGNEVHLDRWYRMADILSDKYNMGSRDVFTKEQLSTVRHSDKNDFYSFCFVILGFINALDDDTLFMFLTDHDDEFCIHEDYPNEKERIIKEFEYYKRK